MGYCNCSNITLCFPQIVNCLLDFSFILLVKSTSSLIENHQFWFFNNRTSKGDSLLLPSRKLTATSTDIGIKPLWILADKVPCICFLERINNLFISSFRAAKQNILFDCAIKQNSLLANITDLFSVVA